MTPRLIWTRVRPGRYTCHAAGYVLERTPKAISGVVWRISYNGQPLAIAPTLTHAKAIARVDAAERRTEAGQV